MQRAIILSRVSSREQAETGYSMSAQKKFLQDYTKSKFVVREEDVFEIEESASGDRQRKIFSEMMAHIKQEKIKTIICEKADRLTRNFRDMVMIDEWLEHDEEREVHLVKDSLILRKGSRSQEKLNWGIRVLLAKNFAENLSEEVKKGVREKLSQGWLPARPKIGYETIGDKGHKTHRINEAEAVYIRKIFSLYATGTYSLKRLMLAMYDAGFRTRNGRRVSISHLQRLLTDPIYIGQIEWMGKIYPGKHKPIISKETFDKVGAILKGKATPKLSKHYYLFKGLFRCANCGGLVTWERHKGIVYGHCNYRYRKCEKRHWVVESDIVSQLLWYFDRLKLDNKEVEQWLLKALKESHSEEIIFFDTTLEKLYLELARWQKRLDGLYDDKLDEAITKQQYDEKFKRFSRGKEQVAQAIAKHSKNATEYMELSHNLYELSQKGRLIYESADPDQKRELLKLVFGKLELDGEHAALEYSKPFQLLSFAVQETNKYDQSSEIIFDFKIANIFSELKNTLIDKRKNTTFGDVHSYWLGR